MKLLLMPTVEHPVSRNTEHAMLFTLPGNKFKIPDFLEPGLDVIIDEDEAYSRFAGL